MITEPLPLTTRVNSAIRLWAFKCFVVVALAIQRLVTKEKLKARRPTYTKRYSVRMTLENRIFIPESWKSGQQLPLYINVHGGGFALCDAAIDICHYFANTYDYCVVSVDYRLAPVHRFPVPVYDVAEITRAVINDKDLAVDKSKVAIVGFSAGGNLSLAVSQFEDIHVKIKGVVAIYPVVEFGGKTEDKLSTVPKGKPDVLANTARLFDWGYTNPGQDRRDPLLSPFHAPRDRLPKKICLIGAEFDMLCDEAQTIANNLAKSEVGEKVGTPTSWKQGGIMWEKVLGWQHAFTHMGAKGEEEKERKKVVKELYEKIAGWLNSEVYA